MYDFSADLWTELPSMQTGRIDHGCGLARKQDGTLHAVVAGGFSKTDGGTYTDTIEIFDLETMTWR